MALELWSNNLKEDSGISKEDFVGLVHQALSKPSDVTTWSYTTDSIEITLKAAKLEELKNRYVDSSAHQKADKDIQDFIKYQSDALSNLEKTFCKMSISAASTRETPRRQTRRSWNYRKMRKAHRPRRFNGSKSFLLQPQRLLIRCLTAFVTISLQRRLTAIPKTIISPSSANFSLTGSSFSSS
nr:hypothetical protein KXZ65_14745 [Pectobacterium sp. PL152]